MIRKPKNQLVAKIAGGFTYTKPKPPKAPIAPQPVAARPVAAAPAQVQPLAPPAAPMAPKSDWHDSGYFSDVAGAAKDRDAGLAQIGLDQSYDQSDYDTAIRGILKRKPDDLQAADESFNKSGLFYSGHLGKARGQIEEQATEAQTAQTTAFQRRSASREAARKALESGYSQAEAAAAAAAVDRAGSRDEEYASTDSLVLNPGSPEPVATTPTAAVRVATRPKTPQPTRRAATPRKPVAPAQSTRAPRKPTPRKKAAR